MSETKRDAVIMLDAKLLRAISMLEKAGQRRSASRFRTAARRGGAPISRSG